MNGLSFGQLMLAAGKMPDPMGHVLPHYLFGSHWFTNQHLMSLVALVGGSVLMVIAARAITIRPEQGLEGYITKGSFAQAIEVICGYIRNDMVKPLLGGMTDRYIYLLWSFFFFILLGNVLGLIPIGSMAGLIAAMVGGPEAGYKWSHLGGTFTGNINFTAGLAIVAFILMHGIAFKEQGLGYVKHCWPVPMKPLWLSPLMLIVNVLLLFLELFLGPAIKAFALCIRLFANMVAGHLVMGSLVILLLTAPFYGKGVGVIGSVIFSVLELFVAFLQAYIFTFLLTIFISLGAVSHDDHDHDEAHEEDHGHATGHA